MCGVPGHLAPFPRCARSMRLVVCAVSWATWLLFTGVPTWFVVLRLRSPGPLGSCSPVRPLCVLSCACGVLGYLAPVHRCARSVRCFACAVSWATWLRFTGVPARCAVLRVRCPGQLGSCSPVCALGPLLCLCGVLAHLALAHRCARLLCFCCVCSVLGHLAPVHRCARSVCCVVCAVAWGPGLLFTGVRARSVALLVWCPGPLGSCSPVCALRRLLCLCGVLGHLAPVHQCARSIRCFACAVSLATWLLFTGVLAQCVLLRVRCPGPLGSCSPVCPPCVLCCVYGLLGPLAPIHGCARSVCCVGCAVSWATWLLFTGVHARCVVLCLQCPGPLGSCSTVCSLGVLCCVLRVRCCVCGASLQGVQSSIRTAAVRSLQGLGIFGARTCASGRRLFCSRQGLGLLPGAHTSIRTPAGVALTPVLVPWFVACCARSPGLRHLAAIVAWHLSLCLGCGWRRASLACLVAPRGAPRLIRSGRSRCSGQLFRRRGAFPHPGGLCPCVYWAALRGTQRPAENRAYCACRWPLLRQGRWARSASYPFGAPR